MAAYKAFKLGILVVFIFVLIMGLITSVQAQEETTRTGKMGQSSYAEGNGYVPQTHTIVLINDTFNPETAEINQYDTVVWRNLEKPKRTVILESGNGLWEDFNLGYGKSFEYTFNETGTYGFSVKGESDLRGTVVVKTARTTGGVVPSSGTMYQNQTQQEENEREEENVTPAPTEEATPRQTAREVQSSESSVVIRGSVFYPEALTLNKGETLVWKNLNKPKHSFTLMSDDKLFGDQIMGYGRGFSYTFNEAGDYSFKLKEAPETKLVVTVR